MAKGNKGSKVTIDKLAVMVNNGFVGVSEYMNKKFGEVSKKFDQVDKRFDKMERDIRELKDGQERVELRLTNVAYNFELRELQGRVAVLEKKTGIKK